MKHGAAAEGEEEAGGQGAGRVGCVHTTTTTGLRDQQLQPRWWAAGKASPIGHEGTRTSRIQLQHNPPDSGCRRIMSLAALVLLQLV